MHVRQLAYLDAMGIDVWQKRATVANSEETKASDRSVVHHEQLVKAPIDSIQSPGSSSRQDSGVGIIEEIPIEKPCGERTAASATDTWKTLREKVASCRNCELYQSRIQTVFGVGDRSADLLVIGEAPGSEEDKQGEPFVGRAGQLLNAMLQAIGIKREQVYITNILKCRPPNNRDPKPEEVINCASYLQRQVAMIQPTAILCVGRIAAQNLLQTEVAVGKLRGRQHHYSTLDVPVIVTYHPAYLLRSPAEKGKAWEDLLLAKTTLEKQSP